MNGIFLRNARACENAQHKRCTCICGGTLHGKNHKPHLERLWVAYRRRVAKNKAAKLAAAKAKRHARARGRDEARAR